MNQRSISCRSSESNDSYLFLSGGFCGEDEFISEEALNDIAYAQKMWYTVPMWNECFTEQNLDEYMVINDSAWERAMHCYVFRNRVEPTCCVIVDADMNRSENIK